MRDDSDFTAYAAARWTQLVRSASLLGSPPDVARDIARAALARCHGDWSHRDELGDLDTHLYRTLLECKRVDRRDWWSGPVQALEAERDEETLWSGLEPELDRLSEPERAWVVLRDVADLSEEQAGAVVGPSAADAPAQRPTDRVRQVCDTIPVDPPPIDSVLRQAAADRTRRRNRGLLLLTGVLGAGAVAALVIGPSASPGSDRQEPSSATGPVEVTRAQNPAPIEWYVGDAMHLDQVTLRVPGVRDFAAVGPGAVYLTTVGELNHVGDDGVRTSLADLGEDGSFAVSDAAGLAAWVTDGPSPELVVRDLAERDDVYRGRVGGDARLVAVDARSVSYVDGRGNQEIDLAAEKEVQKARTTQGGPLLDEVTAMRVFQIEPERIFMEHRSYSVEFTRAGVGAQLSVDGRYVITRVPDNRSRYDAVRIYDARSGEELPTGLRGSDDVIDARLGPDATVTYLISVREEQYEAQPPQMTRDAIFELRTCRLSNAYRYTGSVSPEEDGACTTDISFPHKPGPLLLAR